MNEWRSFPLSEDEFGQLVRFGPLIAIDLIVRNQNSQILISRRRFEPAMGWYFVPGGRIWKNETIRAAFRRIAQNELGLDLAIERARFVGIFEHFYSTSRFEPGVGTHYVVLAYEVQTLSPHIRLDDQHSALEWANDDEILRRADIHEHVKAYFRP